MQQSTPHLGELISTCLRLIDRPDVSQRTLTAYQALVAYLRQRHTHDSESLDIDTTIEAAPPHTALHQALAGVENDPELLRRLLDFVETIDTQQPVNIVGVSLHDVKAKLLQIDHIKSEGSGVEITNTQVDDAINIDHIESDALQISHASNTNRSDRAVASPVTSTPPVVTLTDVTAGGDITIGSVTQKIIQIFQRQPTNVRAQQRRLDMLSLVENTWINGILKPLQDNGALLHLYFAQTPEVVNGQPFAKLVQMPQLPSSTSLSSQNEVVDLFRRHQRQLLILGDPGSGKTILLLQFAMSS